MARARQRRRARVRDVVRAGCVRREPRPGDPGEGDGSDGAAERSAPPAHCLRRAARARAKAIAPRPSITTLGSGTPDTYATA